MTIIRTVNKWFLLGLIIFLGACSSVEHQSPRNATKEDRILYIHGNSKDEKNIIYRQLLKCAKGKGESVIKSWNLKSKGRKKLSLPWNNIGLCYFLAGDYLKASFYFDLAVKKTQGHHYRSALNNTGILHLHFYRYRQALVFFKKAYTRDSRDLIPGVNAARIYIKFGLFSLASKILKDLDRRHKNDFEIKKVWALLKERKKAVSRGKKI